MVKKRLRLCAVRSSLPCGAGRRSGRSPGGFVLDWAPCNAGWRALAKSDWIGSTGLTSRTGHIGRPKRHHGLRHASWRCATS